MDMDYEADRLGETPYHTGHTLYMSSVVGFEEITSFLCDSPFTSINHGSRIAPVIL